MGMIFAIVAGLCMTFQGVFNTRVSEKIGLWETNVFVQGTALIATLLILFFAGNGDFKAIKDVNKLYLTGGLFGAAIIYTVMMGIESLGPTFAIALILIAQLSSAAVVDGFGLFGTEQMKFGITQIIGLVLMIGGIIVFKIQK